MESCILRFYSCDRLFEGTERIAIIETEQEEFVLCLDETDIIYASMPELLIDLDQFGYNIDTMRLLDEERFYDPTPCCNGVGDHEFRCINYREDT